MSSDFSCFRDAQAKSIATSSKRLLASSALPDAIRVGRFQQSICRLYDDAVRLASNLYVTESTFAPPEANQNGGVSMYREFAKAVGKVWRTIGDAFNPYRPELHYMRGPGPKWHAKRSRFVIAN